MADGGDVVTRVPPDEVIASSPGRGRSPAFVREIGATVVAEGIGTARENTVARRPGVRRGHGLHLGRPGSPPPAHQDQAEDRDAPTAEAARPPSTTRSTT